MIVQEMMKAKTIHLILSLAEKATEKKSWRLSERKKKKCKRKKLQMQQDEKEKDRQKCSQKHVETFGNVPGLASLRP
jgi:hypothetical protein